MKKIALVSLGCAKNLIDSEMMLAMFPPSSYELVSSPEGADLIIVNTCAFISSAKAESISTIISLAKYGAKIAVVGCLAQRYKEELEQELQEADLIVPIDDYAELSSRLNELLDADDLIPMNPLRRVISTSPYSAYLRISEGCDNFCAFCAIPHIRGRFVSRPLEEIVEEAKWLKEKGVKEISLVSQDTTCYGKDFPQGRPNIVDLLKILDGMGFFSIRLLYLYPGEISTELIRFIASSASIAHYFDIPVQCAGDHMLGLMRRHVTQQETEQLFKDIRKICPDAVLRTTLIAGFPGESEEDVELTLSFLEQTRFDHMGCFTYSPEEGTSGAAMKNQIPKNIKTKRRDRLMKAQRIISYKANLARVGDVYEGMIVGKSSDGKYLFRCVWNAPDDIDGAFYVSADKPLEEGDIVKAKVTAAFAYDLEGIVLP